MTDVDPLALASALPALGWAVHGGWLTRRLSTARRDPLTGLHTRAGWTARAERLLAHAPHAIVLLIDLDDFKSINDTHGHAAGDAVLTAIGGRLADWCGRSGVAARLGGDEFAAIITNPDAIPDLLTLNAALHTPVQHADRLLPVSASVGVCHVADLPLAALTDALSAADAAMYQAKGHGRRTTDHRERTPAMGLFTRKTDPAPANPAMAELGREFANAKRHGDRKTVRKIAREFETTAKSEADAASFQQGQDAYNAIPPAYPTRRRRR